MEVKGGTVPVSEKKQESKSAGQVSENEKLLKAGLDELRQGMKQLKETIRGIEWQQIYPQRRRENEWGCASYRQQGCRG